MVIRGYDIVLCDPRRVAVCMMLGGVRILVDRAGSSRVNQHQPTPSAIDLAFTYSLNWYTSCLM